MGNAHYFYGIYRDTAAKTLGDQWHCDDRMLSKHITIYNINSLYLCKIMTIWPVTWWNHVTERLTKHCWFVLLWQNSGRDGIPKKTNAIISRSFPNWYICVDIRITLHSPWKGQNYGKCVHGIKYNRYPVITLLQTSVLFWDDPF